MRLRVKPFTLFLCISVIVFLIVGAYLFFLDENKIDEPNFIINEFPSWKGIITLWDISYIDIGTGNRSRWLNNLIKEFEKKNPGIFIDMRRMTAERVREYFSGETNEEFNPDIISLDNYEQTVPTYMLESLNSFFTKEEIDRFHPIAYQRVEREGQIYGVPWMMGGYVLVLNQDLAEERGIILEEMPSDYDELGRLIENIAHIKEEGKNTEIIYGFCSYNSKYSRPLASINYHESGKIHNDGFLEYLNKWRDKEGIIPENMWELSKREAYDIFLSGKSGVILGTTDIIYKVRAEQEQGKGFRIKVGSIPLEEREGFLQDQISAFGIMKQEDSDKLKYCIEFLKFLTTKDVQIELKQLGMFPVVNDVGKIYSDDIEMGMLEKILMNN